ncbi:MAG: hypothetical protein PW734_11665 [Verrucomicrobium sp.]|nr:hypothetical protein [Verrucomicrobium sp.]
MTDLVDRIATVEKGSISKGDEYARKLYQILTLNGVEAHWIEFRWGYASTREYHADFVVFKDSQGRFWARQSTSLQSKWITGRNPQEWLDAYWGPYIGLTGKPLALQISSMVDNRAVISNPLLRQNLATLMASAE